MGFYIFKRLFFIIPFALLLVFCTLILNQKYSNLPSSWENQSKYLNNYSSDYSERLNCEKRVALKHDLPLFYVTFHSSVIPRNLLNICSESERQFLKRLCINGGDMQLAEKLYFEIKKLESSHINIDIKDMYKINDVSNLRKVADDLAVSDLINASLSNYENSRQNWGALIPNLSFNGLDNQFHFWMLGAINFDFGKSAVNNLPVVKVVNDALGRTLLFTIPSVIIMFVISIFLGMTIAFVSEKKSDSILNMLFFIDAIPLFWLSILLIVLAGKYLSFTNHLLGIVDSYSFGKYILPILALVIASIPYLSKQISSSVNHVLMKPFIQTAIAKGISNEALFIKHIIPNALIPVVVLFFNYLAFAFGGAFVVEIIFSISGIGKLMADSVLSNDFQVASLILLYLVIIKMILMLLNDLMQYYIHPSHKLK